MSSVFSKIDNDLDFLSKIEKSINEVNNDTLKVDSWINKEVSMSTIDKTLLSEEQVNTINKVADWWNNKRYTQQVETIEGLPGTGKMCDMELIIPTPNGDKRFGDLKVGDYVFDRKGKPTKVTAIYPQGLQDNYEITLSDGRVTSSGLGHFWTYIDEDEKLITKTLEEIIKDYKDVEYRIPVNLPVEYNLFNDDKNNMFESGKKFAMENNIPEEYLYASLEDRFELLHGIINIYGDIEIINSPDIYFICDNEHFIKQFKKLVWSLGYICEHLENNKILLKMNNYNKHKLFKEKNRQRKILKTFIKINNFYDRLTIVDIKKIGKAEMMCIDVDNDEHLYLTNDFLVTHNCMHEDSSLIYNDGLRPIKEAKIGDKIFDNEGKLCTITGVFKQEDKKVCYKLLFTDGTSIVCDEEQILNYSIDNIIFKDDTLSSLLKIVNKEKIYFPMNKALRMTSKETELPIPLIALILSPYCLDYQFISDYFNIYLEKRALNNNDLIGEIKNIMKEFGYAFQEKNMHRNVLTFQLKNDFNHSLEEKLNSMNLIINGKKNNIPSSILFNSIRNKKIFIESFLCGKLENINEIDIKLKSDKLLKDFRFLIETMGGLVYSNELDLEEFSNDEQVFSIKIVLPRFFTMIESDFLKKELKEVHTLEGTYNTFCIKVDNDSSLYLTDDCITVHNTTIIPHIIQKLELGKASGHALYENTKVLKKNGFVKIKDLKVGDEVCGGDGEFHKVKGIYPQGKREMYKIYFTDGSFVKCDLEHIWTVFVHGEGCKNYTLSRLMEEGIYTSTGNPKFRIPLVEPIQFPERKLQIHPYLLGILVTCCVPNTGDAIHIKLKHPENISRIAELLARINYKMVQIKETKTSKTYNLLPKSERVIEGYLLNKMIELGIKDILKTEDRFIPAKYLFSSEKQRRQLLNGLIDGVGIFDHKSDVAKYRAGNKAYFTVEFIGKSQKLYRDIVFLTESLSGIADFHDIPSAYIKPRFFHVRGIYKLSIKFLPTPDMHIYNKEFDVCDLSKIKDLNRKIAVIEKLNEKEEAICIEVEEKNGLFVVEHCIVTHNTTVSNSVAFICYTAKAAMKLIQKGLNAITIHSLIYQCIVDKKTKEISFKKRTKLPERLKLLVIDEWSMVGESTMEDIKSFGLPILMLGDGEQLPPIGDNPNPYSKRINITMKEPHRQALDSPILKYSLEYRKTGRIKYGDFGKLKVLRKNDIDSNTLKNLVFWADQVLCGYNSTKNLINNSCRAALGRKSLLPEVGDKIICTKNNPRKIVCDFNLSNGMVGIVSDLGINIHGRKTLDFLPEFLEIPFTNLIYNEKIFLQNNTAQGEKRGFLNKTFDEFDYAYAITVHKSQGSEWDKVLLFAENMRDFKKWFYTGLTRAKEELVILV